MTLKYSKEYDLYQANNFNIVIGKKSNSIIKQADSCYPYCEEGITLKKALSFHAKDEKGFICFNRAQAAAGTIFSSIDIKRLAVELYGRTFEEPLIFIPEKSAPLLLRAGDLVGLIGPHLSNTLIKTKAFDKDWEHYTGCKCPAISKRKKEETQV